MISNQILDKIINYLNTAANYKWATANTLVKRLNIEDKFSALALDDALMRYYQNSNDPKIRFSTLPSATNLNVLWGAVSRVGRRNVTDIRRTDTPLRIKEFNSSTDKNMFLSYSFKDSDLVLDLARKLLKHGFNPWIAEIDILERAHINESVIGAISALPYFGTLVTENILNSTWSAKEIDFAFHNKKDIHGFLHSDTLELLVENINDIQAGMNTGRRIEIYKKLFDTHVNDTIKFLLYPLEDEVDYVKGIGYDNVLRWQELNKKN